MSLHTRNFGKRCRRGNAHTKAFPALSQIHTKAFGFKPRTYGKVRLQATYKATFGSKPHTHSEFEPTYTRQLSA